MKSKVAKHASKAKGSLFKYDTNKMVEINSKKIGIIFRFFQLIIVIYIIGYVMIYMNGYQENYGLTGSIVSKVKGVSKYNEANTSRRIWDVPDIVIPPQEPSAFFITTNAIITENQTQTLCPEAYGIDGAQCKSDRDCIKDKSISLGNGIMTGKCVDSVNNKKTCEILAWCPLENDSFSLNPNPMREVLNFTVLIKNTIIFDNLNVKRTNLFMWDSGTIPKNCLYDANHPLLKFCPIFTVSTFLNTKSRSDLFDLLTYGGVIHVIITWNCNLDYKESECVPKYSFSRFDLPDAQLSKGWNFRYSNNYYVNNKEYRILYKVFGLRFLIQINGNARKLSLINLTMNLGSGIAILSAATFICDIIILYFLPNRKKYAETIFELHDDDDAYQELKDDETECNATSK